MSVIEVVFRGSKFSISCDDVERTRSVAVELSNKAAEIAAAYKGGITDLRALFLAAMMLQDEVSDLKKQISSLQYQQASVADERHNMALTVDKVSEYIGGITEIVKENL